MATVHTHNYTVTTEGGSALSGRQLESGTTEQTYDETVPASSTNLDIPLTITAANIRSVLLLADKNCTIKVNSTSSPTPTINLIAGIPLVWGYSQGYFTNPLATNVTHFYVTTTPATRLKYKILTV